jgi:hypothetical protein
MDGSTREAFVAAASTTENIARQLRSAVDRAAQDLPEERRTRLFRAARAPAAALDDLRDFLNRAAAGEPLVGPASPPGPDLPDLAREQALSFLHELDNVYSRVGQELLKPLEQCQLADDELRLLRRHIGTVWAWLISSLQDPLWRQYPDLNPNPES